MRNRNPTAAFLREPLSQGYKPRVFGFYFDVNDPRPWFRLVDVERMRRDPKIRLGLRVLRAPIRRVKWKVKANSDAVRQFVDAQLTRIWKRCLGRLLKMLEYGYCPGEWDYALEDGLIVVRDLIDFYPLDCDPLVLENKIVGTLLRGSGKEVRIGAPRSLWLVNEPEYDRYRGLSRLANAWTPWMEKTGRHGALESRRLWFLKNAYRGTTIRHPTGFYIGDDGTTINYQDAAREIAEKMENGGIIAMNNNRDAKGEFEWQIEEPTINGNASEIREYPRDLDREMLDGMGIPEEVIQASGESGSGYAGRSIPAQSFYGSLDDTAVAVVDGADRSCIWYMVRANFGDAARYEIEIESLLPAESKEQPGGQPGANPGAPGAPQVPQLPGEQMPGVPFPADSGQQTQAARLSLATRVYDQARRMFPDPIRIALSAGESGDPVPADGGIPDTSAIAEWFRSLFEELTDAGHEVPETLIDAAAEELSRGDWTLRFNSGTREWTVIDSGAEAGTVELALLRAPRGGVDIDGKHFPGGQFIPKGDAAKLTPEQREQIEKGQAVTRERLTARGAKSAAGLRERLTNFATSLTDRSQRSARRMLRGLVNHHGDLTHARIDELADALEASLANASPDAQEIIRDRLAQLHWAAGAVDGHLKQEQYKGQGLPSAPEPGMAYNVPTSSLKTDAKRFQFKVSGVGSDGVTSEMKEVRQWNPDFAGIITVWRDPENGVDYVINGHHRKELADRLGVPNMRVQYIDAPDEKSARAKGALINIAEGRGTPVDAAKFMRDTGTTVDDFAAEGISLKGAVARDASSLVNLNDRLFNMVASERMEMDRALAIARELKDPDLQDVLVREIGKHEERTGRELTPKVVAEMAREMAQTPTTEKTEKTLWGEEKSSESLFAHRGEVKAHVRSQLAKLARDFATVASKRRAEVVSGAGNVLNLDENKRIADETEHLRQVFDTFANYRGPLSDTINTFAEKLSHADRKADRQRIFEEAVEGIRTVLPAIVEESVSTMVSGSSPDNQGGAGPGGEQSGSGANVDDELASEATSPIGSAATPPSSPPHSPDSPSTGIVRKAPKILGANEEIADATYARAQTDYDRLRDEYLSKEGIASRGSDGELASVVLNTDDWRDRFPEYRGTNAQDVHEASSYLNKRLLTELLPKMAGKGNNTFVMFGGGGGSGKGTAVAQFFDQSEYPLRLDQVADNVDKIGKQFDTAKANGYSSEFVFVDRHPQDAWNGGVVPRALDERKKGGLGRTVPIEVAVKANIDARKAAIELLKTRLDIPASVIDNNRGAGKAHHIVDRDEAIQYLESQKHDYEQLVESLRNDTLRLHESGEIPDDIAEGLVGKAAIDDRRVQLRSAQGVSGQRGQAGRGAGADLEGAEREDAPSESDAGRSRSDSHHESDHVEALNKIAPGELGYVAGHPVRRNLDDTFRVESQGHYVTGGASLVSERIQRNWRDQLPIQKDIDAALSRADAHEEPNPFTDADRSDSETKARNSLPAGARVVSLDPETRGRFGVIVRKDDGTVGVRLENTPNANVSDFEPLDEELSWRSKKPGKVKPPAATTPPLFE